MTSGCCRPAPTRPWAISPRRRGVREALDLTSNLHSARFDTIFPKGIATAAVDRLLHQAHVIFTEGRSHRRAEVMDGRGVQPLGEASS